MKVNYKTILENAPVSIKNTVEKLARTAYVTRVEQFSPVSNIYAYSPVFKDIVIHTSNTMGCKRGDEIEIKINAIDPNFIDLVQNITLNKEIEKFEKDCFCPRGVALAEAFKILKWRDEQLENQLNNQKQR